MQTGSALRLVKVDWLAVKELKVSNHNGYIYTHKIIGFPSMVNLTKFLNGNPVEGVSLELGDLNWRGFAVRIPFKDSKVDMSFC